MRNDIKICCINVRQVAVGHRAENCWKASLQVGEASRIRIDRKRNAFTGASRVMQPFTSERMVPEGSSPAATYTAVSLHQVHVARQTSTRKRQLKTGHRTEDAERA